MKKILEKLQKGEISVDEAEKLIKIFAIQEIGNVARLDAGREFRKGMPEIVLAEGKTPEDVRDIASGAVKETGRVVISRATTGQIEAIKEINAII